MAIQSTCSCGATIDLPADWAKNPPKCKACNKAFLPAGKTSFASGVKKAKGAPNRTLLFILCFIGLSGIMALLNRRSSDYTPTPIERSQDKYKRVNETFSATNSETASPVTEDTVIRKTVENFVAAIGSGNGQRATTLMDLRRLLAQVESITPIPGLETRTQEKELLKDLEEGFPGTFREIAASSMAMKSVRVLRVLFDSSHKEAQCYGLVSLAAGGRSKMRFWLIQGETEWKIFDFEYLEDSRRVSLNLASVFQTANLDEANLRKFQQSSLHLRSAIDQVAGGNFESALQSVHQVRRLSPPRFLLGQLELIEGVAYLGIGQAEDALQAGERALAVQSDFPAALHLKATAMLHLQKYSECIRFENAYLELLGDDAEAYSNIGAAHQGLEEYEKAVEAYRKGAAADPEEYDNRFRLALLHLNLGKEQEAGSLFLEAIKNAGPDTSYFDAAANQLLAHERYEDLLALCEDQTQRTPGHNTVHDYTGSALIGLGRLEEAEKLTRKTPADPVQPPSKTKRTSPKVLTDSQKAALEDYDRYDAEIWRLFSSQDFAGLEECLEDHYTRKSRWHNGDWRLWNFYDVLDRENLQLEYVQTRTNAWASQFPKSSAPKIILARHYVNLAWQARGGGYADTVSASGWKGFKKYLNLADQALEEGLARNPEDPEIYMTWVPVRMGLNGDPEEIIEIALQGAEAEPMYYHLYKQTTAFLLPKWSGKAEYLKVFADRVLAKLGKEHGPEIYGILAENGFQQMENNNYFETYRLSWPTIKAGYELFLKQYPKADRRLNYFCLFAVSAQDKETAKELFQKIGPWRSNQESIWQTKKIFDSCREWAMRP